MTVGELIEKLQEFDKDMIIVYDIEYYRIAENVINVIVDDSENAYDENFVLIY